MQHSRYHRSAQAEPGWEQKILQIVNLRPEESERTFLMFAAYSAFSIGILWLEMSSSALFLEEYGARALPWILIASAGMGFGLNTIYSWMQRWIPLRRVIVVTTVLMALPLLLFWVGLQLPYLAVITIFVMRLWMEAIFILNELNISVTANQIFNIREIKRAYPLISSGNLISDVVSGFSLPLVLAVMGLQNVLILIFIVMILGAVILLYLSETYRQAFPDARRRRQDGSTGLTNTTIRDHNSSLKIQLQGPIGEYVILLFGFFILSQVIYLLIDFQYLSQLKLNLDLNAIAGFLGVFSGILGLVELVTQWFLSSRAIERVGVFFSIALLPILLPIIAALPLFGLLGLGLNLIGWQFTDELLMLFGLVGLKFVDELLRYTLLSSTTPVLFQPIPNELQSRLQSLVRGLAEPLSMAGVGIFILVMIAGLDRLAANTADSQWLQGRMFLVVTIAIAGIWLAMIGRLRSRFFKLLVLCADRGELSTSNSNLPALRQTLIEELGRSRHEADQAGYIDLLKSIGLEEAGRLLAPLLPSFSPLLQRQSLEIMLAYPKVEHLPLVQALLQSSPPPAVLALAMRYIWLTEANPDIHGLRPYLDRAIDPVVRGTAAALMLKRGNAQEQSLARQTLYQMLTHERTQERAMGCKALGEAGCPSPELQELIPQLLRDPALVVRQEVLATIALTRNDTYYASLLRGLHYKSTSDAAVRALSHLGNPAIPLLMQLAQDPLKPEMVRLQALNAISQIATPEAQEALILPLPTTWGHDRRLWLRALLRLPNDQGIEAVLDRLGRRGVEFMLNQELMFLGQMLAGVQDLRQARLPSQEADFLCRALIDLQADSIDRLFLTMRFLYDADTMQAAEFSILRSGSSDSMARGLEILDGILDVPNKPALITVLEQRSDLDKLRSLSPVFTYEPLAPSDRLRYLLNLRHFLSHWAIACCFHLARTQRWNVTAEHVLAGLRVPTGFVREAVVFYLEVVSPRTLSELLPVLQQDPDPLVAAQARSLAQRP